VGTIFEWGSKSQGTHFEKAPLNPTMVLGSAIISPSGVCGGAPAKIEFDAF